MTPAHYLSLWNWILLILNIVTEGAVLVLCLRRRIYKKLVMLPIFAGFCFVADFVMTCAAFSVKAAPNGSAYTSAPMWALYWGVQAICGVLVLLLVLQVLTITFPEIHYFVLLVAVLAIMATVAVYFKLLPFGTTTDALALTWIASAIGLAVLCVVWIVSPARWPPGVSLVVAGLMTSAVLQLAFVLAGGFLHSWSMVSLGVPFASLVGMGCFLAAVLTCHEPYAGHTGFRDQFAG